MLQGKRGVCSTWRLAGPATATSADREAENTQVGKPDGCALFGELTHLPPGLALAGSVTEGVDS